MKTTLIPITTLILAGCAAPKNQIAPAVKMRLHSPTLIQHPQSAPAAEYSDIQTHLLTLHNQARSAQNLPALQFHPGLTQYAQHWAQTMAQRGTMTHSHLTFFSHSGFRIAAENIAFNQPTPDIVTDRWMNSPGHRRNILHPRHQYVGFAQTLAPQGHPYWCAIFGG